MKNGVFTGPFVKIIIHYWKLKIGNWVQIY